MSRRSVVRSLVVLGSLFVVLQLVPYGRERTNPPVVREPAWNSPRTRELFLRACVDCHSNETAWPWYSRVAPVSWLVVSDVDEGREHLNVSEWHREQRHAHEAAEMVREGKMPLWFYTPLHPRARLAPAERDELIRGLAATLGDDP